MEIDQGSIFAFAFGCASVVNGEGTAWNHLNGGHVDRTWVYVSDILPPGVYLYMKQPTTADKASAIETPMLPLNLTNLWTYDL